METKELIPEKSSFNDLKPTDKQGQVDLDPKQLIESRASEERTLESLSLELNNDHNVKKPENRKIEDQSKEAITNSTSAEKAYPSFINLIDKFSNLSEDASVVGKIGAMATAVSIPFTIGAGLPELSIKATILCGTISTLLAVLGESKLITYLAYPSSNKELENRVGVSEMMTVSKAFSGKNSLTGRLIQRTDPVAEQQPFYGELHFVGGGVSEKSADEKKPQSPIPSLSSSSGSGGDYIKEDRIARIKDAFDGLSNLAEMCRNDDQRVKNMNFFIGSSHLITPSFTKYGFSVFSEEQLEKSNLFKKVNNWIESQVGKKENKKESTEYYAVISRQQLINFEEFYKSNSVKLQQIGQRHVVQNA